MSFIAAIDAELDALHNALSANPTFVKWRELQRVRSLYDSGEGEVSNPPPDGLVAYQAKSANFRGDGDGGSRGRRADPERARAVQEAESIIRSAAGNPVPTSDILEILHAGGITIPGERPLNNLSAMLSNSGLFEANGRRGWTLKQDGDDSEVSEKFEEQMSDIIIHYVGHFHPTEVQYVSDYYRDNNQIPPDIDGRLLAMARSNIGRELSRPERSVMRDNFVKFLHKMIGENT